MCFTIQATRSAKYKSGKLILDERNFESLIRQFDFEAVDKQNITASFENGLLTITCQKSNQAMTLLHQHLFQFLS